MRAPQRVSVGAAAPPTAAGRRRGGPRGGATARAGSRTRPCRRRRRRGCRRPRQRPAVDPSRRRPADGRSDGAGPDARADVTAKRGADVADEQSDRRPESTPTDADVGADADGVFPQADRRPDVRADVGANAHVPADDQSDSPSRRPCRPSPGDRADVRAPTPVPTPMPACCVEHQFSATGEVESTTCNGGRSPWDYSTMTDLCTAGYSEYGAAAPPPSAIAGRRRLTRGTAARLEMRGGVRRRPGGGRGLLGRGQVLGERRLRSVPRLGGRRHERGGGHRRPVRGLDRDGVFVDNIACGETRYESTANAAHWLSGNDAPDHFYVITPAETAYYHFSTCGSDYDTMLYLTTSSTDEADTCLRSPAPHAGAVSLIGEWDDPGQEICESTGSRDNLEDVWTSQPLQAGETTTSRSAGHRLFGSRRHTRDGVRHRPRARRGRGGQLRAHRRMWFGTRRLEVGGSAVARTTARPITTTTATPRWTGASRRPAATTPNAGHDELTPRAPPNPPGRRLPRTRTAPTRPRLPSGAGQRWGSVVALSPICRFVRGPRLGRRSRRILQVRLGGWPGEPYPEGDAALHAWMGDDAETYCTPERRADWRWDRRTAVARTTARTGVTTATPRWNGASRTDLLKRPGTPSPPSDPSMTTADPGTTVLPERDQLRVRRRPAVRPRGV